MTDKCYVFTSVQRAVLSTLVQMEVGEMKQDATPMTPTRQNTIKTLDEILDELLDGGVPCP